MKKEEAKAKLLIHAPSMKGLRKEMFVEVIDKIYDDFESRTCINCNYYVDYPNVCCNSDSLLCSEFVDKDFGCNKFERKQCTQNSNN